MVGSLLAGDIGYRVFRIVADLFSSFYLNCIQFPVCFRGDLVGLDLYFSERGWCPLVGCKYQGVVASVMGEGESDRFCLSAYMYVCVYAGNHHTSLGNPVN